LQRILKCTTDNYYLINDEDKTIDTLFLPDDVRGDKYSFTQRKQNKTGAARKRHLSILKG